jgi:hypothetical protein
MSSVRELLELVENFKHFYVGNNDEIEEKIKELRLLDTNLNSQIESNTIDLNSKFGNIESQCIECSDKIGEYISNLEEIKKNQDENTIQENNIIYDELTKLFNLSI